MPSESNGKMLSAAMNRDFMLHLLEDSRTEFDEAEYEKYLSPPKLVGKDKKGSDK